MNIYDEHPLPWTFSAFGKDDEFIRDAKGNALVHVGFNSSQRGAIAKAIINAINQEQK